jgi:hypothetical protein
MKLNSQYIGSRIESVAYALAPSIAMIIVAVQLTYKAGGDLHRTIENWNDQLVVFFGL